MSAPLDLARLFRREGPRLVRFLRRFGPDTAQDIAQDSFERLCAAEPGTIASPRAYLFRTARNLAISAARRQAIAPVCSVDPGKLEVPAPGPNPEEQAVRCELLARFEQALGQVAEHKRLAVVLIKLEGRSYKEIGERLGVSPRTVERYVADAIAHCHNELRAFLRED